ncbi:MAG TPA: class I SAM-dependent methyltransferase [Candidatus Aenigmarchaeota archaeon]|nr:class I SAM-dependent methyltransferase [Candidatus Aenigmarchaeota archaeon]
MRIGRFSKLFINADHENPRGHLIGKAILKSFYNKDCKIMEIGGQEWQMKKYFPKIIELDLDNKWRPDVLCDAEDMKPIKSNTFDIIYSSHFFEHVYKPEKVLVECNRVLKMNGKLIFIVPVVNINRLWLDGDKWNLHQHHFNKKNLTNLLNLSGFRMINFEYRLWVKPFCLEKPLGCLFRKGDIIFTAEKVLGFKRKHKGSSEHQ